MHEHGARPMTPMSVGGGWRYPPRVNHSSGTDVDENKRFVALKIQEDIDTGMLEHDHVRKIHGQCVRVFLAFWLYTLVLMDTHEHEDMMIMDEKSGVNMHAYVCTLLHSLVCHGEEVKGK